MTKEQEEQESIERVYLDANVFVYSAMNEKEVGVKAREIIEKIKNNVYKGFTSVLTIDEMLWAMQKEIGKEKSAEIANDFISMKNLTLIPADIETIKKALTVYKENLNPRDAIHLASMQIKNIKTLISSDPDFDKIKTINRIDFTK